MTILKGTEEAQDTPLGISYETIPDLKNAIFCR